MLQPKRTKFRKAFKGRIHGNAKGGTELNFGAYGLKAMEPERITARQIEAARRAITRHIKRAGRLWIRIFPDLPVSSKPAGTWAISSCTAWRPCSFQQVHSTGSSHAPVARSDTPRGPVRRSTPRTSSSQEWNTVAA